MTEQAVLQWITAYGYFGIFSLLILGIIGLPVPDEWLLVLSGYLVFKDVLGLFPTRDEAYAAYLAAKQQLHEGNTLC